MSRDEIIEQAARVLSTLTTCDGQPHATELHRRQARALADAGLLAQPHPTREEIAMSIAAREWSMEIRPVHWTDMEPEAQLEFSENCDAWEYADAVLALLKGNQS